MSADDQPNLAPVARRDRALSALLFGFLLLVAAVLAAIWLTVQEQRAMSWVRHTLEVENQLSRVLSGLQDAETGERGFLLTNRNEFLTPYEDAVDNLSRDLPRLSELVADNPTQLAASRRLAEIARTREQLLSDAIAAFREGETLPAAHFLRGRALMEQLRAIVAEMKEDEQRLLVERNHQAERYASAIIAALAASTLLVIVLGALAYVNNRRRFGQLARSRNALAQANEKLIEEAESRAAAETQLRQMQKVEAVGQLTGGIAHDFNNMLTLVIGSLDLAARRLAAGQIEAVAKGIDNALEGARRAAQLTARLLAFSRQQPLAPQPLDVNKLVGGMSELLRRTIGEHLRVETVLAGGLWRAFVDANQLESAVVNLCVNARDAMPEGGKLTIETSNAYLDDEYASRHAEVGAGQYVLMSVTDTGTGMPAEVVERVFDPFYTTKGVGKGTGLGLSQVYGFVKQSRGHVKIYSEPGTGTTIKLYLPRFSGVHLEADGPGEVTGAVTPELPRARDGEIILVVEDDEHVRHVSVDTLRELGYTVVQAGDANQALAILALQPRIDLLFTDVVMPDMNGRELVEKARETRPDLRILYTTGYTRNAIVHNGMLDAGVELLAKPFTVEQLARKIRQVLDNGEG